MAATTFATVEDLCRVEEKAELVGGRLRILGGDLLSADVVRVYRASGPERPTVYRRGEEAEAEPAVPGWRMPVDELFE